MGDTKMRRQVLAGIVAVGLFTVAPVYATVIDFSTDPNLATQWTQFDYFNANNTPQPWATATWNSTDQDLDLAANTGANKAEGYRGIHKTGDTRSDTDGVTVTFSGYQGTYGSNGWNNSVGLVVSTTENANLTAFLPSYLFLLDNDTTTGFQYKVLTGSNLAVVASKSVATLPSTLKFDILRDGSDYVFMGNGVEIARDSSVTASMPYYHAIWDCHNTESLTVSMDDYGTVGIPEPGTLLLLTTGLLGLVCYAWRKRK
jgi:hypothetical protein